jgi:polar amino acid transport system substrate-binding protein
MRKVLTAVSALVVLVALVAATTATGAPRSAAAIPGCAPGSLTLVKSGQLTIGADNPAYPPWFGGAEKTKPWKVSDPYSGKGYESAVAYAIAAQLGFAKSAVQWTVVPFNNSYRPGKKPFDLYLTQVSWKPERARAADFSKSYYFVNQTLVALKGKALASAKSIADLKNSTLGAQIGTTSADYITKVIKPKSAKIYDSNDLAVQALKNGRIDGIVVDLPTAFYVTGVQVPSAKIVGRLRTVGAPEYFGAVLAKGSTLTPCVNKAINRLWANSTIKRLQRIWLPPTNSAPVLK